MQEVMEAELNYAIEIIGNEKSTMRLIEQPCDKEHTVKTILL